MGLYGALIVRPPAAGQAYDDPATAFDDEAVLVLSEIDPALNNSATPATFDMRKYAPRYFLINGRTHPDTAPVVVPADTGPATCCCATSTPGTSTTRWRCWEPTRPSSPSTAAR